MWKTPNYGCSPFTCDPPPTFCLIFQKEKSRASFFFLRVLYWLKSLLISFSPSNNFCVKFAEFWTENITQLNQIKRQSSFYLLRCRQRNKNLITERKKIWKSFYNLSPKFIYEKKKVTTILYYIVRLFHELIYYIKKCRNSTFYSLYPYVTWLQ